MNTFSDVRIKNLIIAVLAILGLFLLIQSVSVIAGIKQKRNVMPSNVITVRGVGEVMGTPDIATFSFTVRENNADITVAQQAMTEKSNKVIEYLKQQAVEDRDIKVESYFTNPTYQYVGGVCASGSCSPSRQVLTGYEVAQTTSVKVRDIGKAGAFLTGVANLKVGEVSSLSFTIDDIDALKIESKKQAIQKARAEAKTIADALGVNLDRVVGFYEENIFFGDRSANDYEEMSMMSSVKVQNTSVSPELPAGEQKITATVSITYEVGN